jgi:hypothetical protein
MSVDADSSRMDLSSGVQGARLAAVAPCRHQPEFVFGRALLTQARLQLRQAG